MAHDSAAVKPNRKEGEGGVDDEGRAVTCPPLRPEDYEHLPLTPAYQAHLRRSVKRLYARIQAVTCEEAWRRVEAFGLDPRVQPFDGPAEVRLVRGSGSEANYSVAAGRGSDDDDDDGGGGGRGGGGTRCEEAWRRVEAFGLDPRVQPFDGPAEVRLVRGRELVIYTTLALLSIWFYRRAVVSHSTFDYILAAVCLSARTAV
jgi:hypothetical protein